MSPDLSSPLFVFVPRTFDLHGVALKHSALQVFWSILTYKRELETKQVVITSEELSKKYMENIRFAKEEEAVSWLIGIFN